jgi:cation:H+ antiporter
MAASASATRISSWCFVACLLAPPCSSSEPSASRGFAELELELANETELYLVVELEVPRLAVRARGVELSSWPLDHALLLARTDRTIALPVMARMPDWPAPRTRSFHVIPGTGGGGQAATLPSELPARWGAGLEVETLGRLTLAINDHRGLGSTGRRWLEALSGSASGDDGVAILALELEAGEARDLYHLARPGLRVLITDRAPAALAIALPEIAPIVVPEPPSDQPPPPSPARSALLLLGGLFGLVLGGELLVRGAVRLATAAGLSTLVVGLTVVAYGTSAPELAVTLKAALTGAGDLGLGNVVGSNIFNILVILGLSALVRVLTAHPLLIRRDVTTMIAVSVLLGLVAIDGTISRIDGVILLLLGLAYTAVVVRSAPETSTPELIEEISPEIPRGDTSKLLAVGAALTAAGIGALVVAAGWLVEGASAVARSFGVSDLVIGLTIVAAGTSLPEVATSIVAAFKGERDIAVGNVIGSNIFNIAWVLGLGATIGGGFAVAGAAATTDLPLMIAVAVLIWPLLRSGHRLVRLEALLLLVCYGLYLAELWGRSVG